MMMADVVQQACLRTNTTSATDLLSTSRQHLPSLSSVGLQESGPFLPSSSQLLAQQCLCQLA